MTNSFLLLTFNLDLAGHGFTVRGAIGRRIDNCIELDDGLSRGWTTLPPTLPAVAIDSEAELTYVYLPNAIKSAGLVCINLYCIAMHC